MGTTTTGNIGAGVNILYDKKFLRVLKEQVRIAPLGQKRHLPKGSGKQIDFFQYNKIPVTLTSGVVDSLIATEGTDPTATAITGVTKSVTVKAYGDFSKHTRMLKATHIDRELLGVVGLWGQHAAETLDLVTQQEIVSAGAMPIRADLDATFSHSGTFSAVASITSMNDITLDDASNFGDADDDLNMAVIYITSGVAKGFGGTVTDYDETGGATENLMTVAGLGKKPEAGDSYTVVSPAALSSATGSNADSLNTAQIRRGIRHLRTFDAQKTASGDFIGVFSPETEEGLMADDKWVTLAQYSAQVEGKGGGLFAGEVGRWGGVRWISTTVPFKFPTQADPAVSGATKGVGAAGINYSALPYAVGAGITCSYIFGEQSFGTVQFDGFGKNGGMAPKIIIKTPGSQTVSQPLNQNSTVAWYAAFAAKMLQPLNCVQLWSAEPQI